MEIAQHRVLPATPVARRTTGPPSAERGDTALQDAHPPWEGHSNKGRGDQADKHFKKGKGGTGNKQHYGKKPGTPKTPFKPKTHKALFPQSY